MWVNSELFIEKEIPRLHPKSMEYRDFWREQKTRCIEGYWVGGKWMPGNLYFYLNYGTIQMDKGRFRKTKSFGRPKLFDFIWEVAYYWQEARGLAGFSNMPECQALIEAEKRLSAGQITIDQYLEVEKLLPDIRELLQNSTEDLGKPLYLREAKNMMWMANRGCGKSYFVASAIVAHEWLFNGVKSMEEDKDKENPPVAHITVGAGDTKYSNDILNKVKMTVDNLPGKIEIGGKVYPPPFSRKYDGSWASGRSIIQQYKKKEGGKWEDKGTKSVIKHVAYGDNPFAAQGTRNSVMVKEEIGMFNTLMDSHNADVSTMLKDGNYKYGSCMYIGTGGDMESGTLDAAEMFYDPDTYDCISFEDTWENKGKIGYFLPATYGKIEYKNPDGTTNLELAIKKENQKREELRKGKNAATALDAHIQYNPLVPSEVFLAKSGNIFPRKELMDWLAVLENNDKYRDVEHVGTFGYDEDGKVKWEPDMTGDLHPIRKFPIDPKKHDTVGAVVIWEHPDKDELGDVPFGLYVAGLDPYDHDEAGTQSLGSIIIYKRFKSADEWFELPVAEYTGRPKADEFYKEALKLLQYYNARVLYENEKKGFYTYAVNHNLDYLLFEQPSIIKDIVPDSKVNRAKGIHMSKPLKTFGETMIKNWLEEELEPGLLQLRKIRSVPLLKELIAYNREGNFDRVMAFMMCMYAIKEHEKLVATQQEEYVPIQNSKFFNKGLFKKGKSGLADLHTPSKNVYYY